MVKIRVPATSANIGPGFDCLGIAFRLYNTFLVEEAGSGLEIYGCSEEYRNENNLVYTSMKSCFDIIGYRHRGIRLEMDCSIPISRGLGSSAACILGGVIGANEIASAGLNKQEILEIAAKIEGHPDNAAPALYGGMTAAVMDGKNVVVEKQELSDQLGFYALIPSFTLSTKESRAVLPSEVSMKDAVFNIGRTAILMSGLNKGNAESIKAGCDDRLHQLYRGKLIKDYSYITDICRSSGALGVFLSGAGPTIMAIIDSKNKEFAEAVRIELLRLEGAWTLRQLEVDRFGAAVG
ncbi:MAG: homoserine kinase [Bacillota bacterium]